MKLSQVAIQVHRQKIEPLGGVKYQNRSEYVSMFISNWLKAKKLQLGEFNRFVFQELVEPVDDLKVVGEKAFAVGISLEYPEVDLQTAQGVHQYFVRKYLEGFERVDAHFGLSLTEELREVLPQEYALGNYFYEKKIAGKRLSDSSVQLFDHYTHAEYQLILRTTIRRELVREEVIFTFEPDVFRVKFRVKKINITDEGVEVIDSLGRQTLFHAFQQNV